MSWYLLLEWVVVVGAVGASAVFLLRRMHPTRPAARRDCGDCKDCSSH